MATIGIVVAALPGHLNPLGAVGRAHLGQNGLADVVGDGDPA